MKQYLTALRNAISGRDLQGAKGILLAALGSNPEKFVKASREQGVFRSYRYGFQSDIISDLAETALSQGGANLLPNSQDYLRSILALSELAPAVAASLKKVNGFVNSGQFKTFLLAIELLFRRMHSRACAETFSTWRNFTLEELAEGFSYFFSVLREKDPPRLTDINKLLPVWIDSGLCFEKLAVFASVVRFKEAEFQVEAFPYLASTQGNVTTVQAISPEFEKSIRLGHIVTAQQQEADRARFIAQGGPSIKGLASAFVEGVGERV